MTGVGVWQLEMAITTMTSREFKHSIGRAKRAAANGPVVVTDQGRPTHVLVTYEQWLAVTGAAPSIADVLAGDVEAGGLDVEASPLPLSWSDVPVRSEMTTTPAPPALGTRVLNPWTGG